ncbi:MFS transporter [Kitasatospora acidiphila]|uniref:MFS transporter n=1 Tax=Kitasatospora acidiphila TaxID=2567942 RepID=A0A540VWQ2_9ACTN|nr:MFS transporter [Kitasatospora acidiphila]TQF01191.1 MFS transporter [Kitasatospora acidiphila]
MTTAQQTLAQPPAPAPRSLLTERPFRLLYTAAAVSKLGTAVSSLAIPLVAVVALHADAAQVGLLATLSTVAFLLIGLPAGAWVDRSPKRPVMIAADLVRAAALGSVPAAWALGRLTFAHLCAAVLVSGVATVFFDVASLSNLPELVGRDRLTEANAHLVTTDALTQIGGRTVGGLLLAAVAAPAAVLVDAASYLWSAACLLRLGPGTTPAPRADRRAGIRQEIGAGLRFVWRDPVLRPIALAGGCTNLSIQLSQTVLPLLITRELGLPSWVLGLFFAVGGLGVLLGSRCARPLARRFGAGRVLWLMGLAVAPFGLLIALVDRGGWLWAAALGWLVTTFKVGIDNVVKVSFRQAVTPDHMLGRMNATMRFVLTGALCVGSALAGLLGTVLGVRAALWAAAVGLALVWVPIARSPLRRVRALPGT